MKVDRWLGLLRPSRTEDVPAAAPAAPAPAKPLPAPDSAVPPKLPAGKQAGTSTVLVTVLGLEGEALGSVIATVTAECRQTRTRPLFITDSQDFAQFRQAKALFEQVIDPAVCAKRDERRDWHGYALTQYRLIGQKWKPVTTIAFGRAADPALLEAIQAGSREKF